MYKNHYPTSFNSPSKPKQSTIDFFPYISNVKMATMIRAKLAPSGTRYLELELFKQQLQGGDDSPDHTYAISQEKVRRYRTIFFGIGVLFFFLTALIFRQNMLIFSVFFGNIGLLAKGFLGGISLALGLCAAIFGYSLCIAKEAGHHLASKTKRKLLKLYGRKRLEQGLQGFFSIGQNYTKYTALKHEYRHAIELVEEQREITTYLLRKIQKYGTVEASYRELLFNQALAELNDRLKEILHKFKAS
jgi:hypothetical protein